jgi:hypothetical protein
LTKYYYKPVVELVEKVYLENAKKEFFEDGRFDLDAELMVEAESEEDSLKIRMGLTDIRMWVLDRTED